MALAPASLFKGIVSRLLYTPTSDGPEAEGYARLKRYRDVGVESRWSTDHGQADEGSLYVASMVPGQTAIQMGIEASFVATLAAFVLYNSDPAGGRTLLLKALKLSVLTVGTSGVDLRYAVVLDPSNRTPSTISNAAGSPTGLGTAANQTGYRPAAGNCNSASTAVPAGVPYFTAGLAASAGPMTEPAASPIARLIVGNAYWKISVLVA